MPDNWSDQLSIVSVIRLDWVATWLTYKQALPFVVLLQISHFLANFALYIALILVFDLLVRLDLEYAIVGWRLVRPRIDYLLEGHEYDRCAIEARLSLLLKSNIRPLLVLFICFIWVILCLGRRQFIMFFDHAKHKILHFDIPVTQQHALEPMRDVSHPEAQLVDGVLGQESCR